MIVCFLVKMNKQSLLLVKHHRDLLNHAETHDNDYTITRDDKHYAALNNK